MANIEKKDEQPLKAQISENEYKELLRQTVAVIENARASIALHLARKPRRTISLLPWHNAARAKQRPVLSWMRKC